MTTGPQVSRTHLPIPSAPRTGLVTYDAKDPDTPHPLIRDIRPPEGAPNILVILYDDTGQASWSPYGGRINMPTLDKLADNGLTYTQWHTTALCSPTRSTFLTGRNHHAVGMGCLANFDSGFPGYRGKIAPEAATLPEMLRPHGYVNYMVGKWHVTPLNETGPTGPFDGWPLGRGYDRFYGFMDAETDQYAPELVRDNTPIDAPGSYETGYHLSVDLVGTHKKMSVIDRETTNTHQAVKRPAQLGTINGAHL